MIYKDGRYPIYPYSEEEKQNIRRELGLKQSIIDEDVSAILEWFEKQPQLIGAGLPDRDFVERMLIAAKGSREKTKKRIDHYYRHRSYAPELIQDREKFIKCNKGLWTFYRQAAMPKLYEFKRITVMQFTDPDPKNFDIEVLYRNVLMLGDLRMKYDYFLGDIWIVDLTQTSIGHLWKANPMASMKASNIFTDGLGVRLYGIHVLGAPAYTNQIIQFFSKVAKPKLIERIIFHNSIEELYKYVPKEYLPKEYGGTEPSLEYFKDSYTKIFQSEETLNFFKECSKQISEESKRPESIYDESYLAGSFKKLEVD